ncbi:DUF3108 domain-containing protein [Lutibacter sp. HS1-25]|uniref:DUF3108 domain-containing protein n=1 Tax=Lutibacter sp. HS1-25 TaxID=2485000 RepID=UPI00101300F0|nr:DUF3108 domain-containing protein [Lutibacter sp. HS1-25]RXP61387.1 DUF3108 domain-containing protein [Lutibacter sp. HS1-25]
MRKYLSILLFLSALTTFGQSEKQKENTPELAFKKGEWLKYRMSYSNFLNAGFATLDVKQTRNNGQEAFHVKGFGETTGVISWFFKVEDNYQTYFYKESLQPYRFIRKINEGGYTKNKEILFNSDANLATVKNFKKNTQQDYKISNNIQDMLSALYYLRNQDLQHLSTGQSIELKLFFDEETYVFKLQYLGKEIIKTKFGSVNSLIFKPLVQAGRVFKEEESVTIWISDDKNKIPLRIKASLAVGSLRADLDEFKGLAHPFNIIFNN